MSYFLDLLRAEAEKRGHQTTVDPRTGQLIVDIKPGVEDDAALDHGQPLLTVDTLEGIIR